MTFKQASDINAKIKKGSKGKLIVFYMIREKEVKVEGQLVTKRYPYLKYYNIFGLSEIEGIDPKLIEKKMNRYFPEGKDNKNIDDIDSFIKDTGADIRTNCDRAFYLPSEDYISLPAIEQFNSTAEYYSTMFHELTHWTGHESRLNREIKNGFGSEKYGKEELVAEIGSSLLNYHFGIETDYENTASYIAGWKKAIKENSNIIFESAKKSEEAFKYLIKEGDDNGRE